MSQNLYTCIGRITKDPENKSKNGKVFVPFTVAVGNKIKNEQGEYDSTFLNCISFSHAANHLIKWGTKGCRISLIGSLKQNIYTDQNGNKRDNIQVVVSELTVLDKAKIDEPNAQALPKTNTILEEIPF